MQWPNATASADAEGMPAGLAESGGLQLNGLDLPCTEDPELFFAESPQDVESAKALCRDCAVRLACLAGAVARREPWGVWGGELLLQGTVVPRKRPRGRPRKTEVAA
jgi:WhiB family redox-sensing transcriptional regulator